MEEKQVFFLKYLFVYLFGYVYDLINYDLRQRYL